MSESLYGVGVWACCGLRIDSKMVIDLAKRNVEIVIDVQTTTRTETGGNYIATSGPE